MPALPWIPISDEAAARLSARATAAGIRMEALASRILHDYAEAIAESPAVAAPETEALLAELEQSIERHWRANPDQRTGTENIIMACIALDREVNNGGFDQFFRNSSRRWAAFAPDAFLHIGRREAAAIARRAVRAVGRFQTPAEFEQKLQVPNTRRDDKLAECDIAFYQLTGISDSILAFASSHPEGLLRH